MSSLAKLLHNRYELRGKSMATCKRSMVELATDNKTGDIVALKISEDFASHQREKAFLKEVQDAGHVCRMLDCFDFKDGSRQLYCLVLEGGDEDLFAYWERHRRRLGLSESSWIARNIALAVAFLHDNGYVHCDIKPHNVVRFYDGRWKLIDFEMVVREGESTLGLTIGYMPPENAKAHPGSLPAEKSQDIWSFGVLLYELMVGRPFLDQLPSSDAVLAWLRSPAPVQLPSNMSDAHRDLLSLMLNKDPSERPTIHEILLHPAVEVPGPFRERRITVVGDEPTELSVQRERDSKAECDSSPVQKDLATAVAAARDREVDGLRERVLALGRDKARLVEEKSQLEGKISWLQQEIGNMGQKLQSLQDSAGRLRATKEQLERDLLRLRKENVSLKASRDEAERAEQKLQQTQSMLNDAVEEKQRLHEDVLKLRLQLRGRELASGEDKERLDKQRLFVDVNTSTRSPGSSLRAGRIWERLTGVPGGLAPPLPSSGSWNGSSSVANSTSGTNGTSCMNGSSAGLAVSSPRSSGPSPQTDMCSSPHAGSGSEGKGLKRNNDGSTRGGMLFAPQNAMNGSSPNLSVLSIGGSQ